MDVRKVIEKRRGSPATKEERARIKDAHQQWVQMIQSRLSLILKDGRATTIRALAPIGHNVSKERRVVFKKRQNAATGKLEGYLPIEKLEEVVLTHFVLIEPSKGKTSVKDRTYYLVRPGLDALKRVVWGRYCSLDLTVGEILQLPKKML